MGFFDAVGKIAARAAERLSGRRALQPEQSTRFKKLQELNELYWGEQYERRGLQAPWDKQTPGRNVPLRSQKPSTQYDLPRLIVDRPVALLFGEGRFPELSFEPSIAGTDVSDVNAWLAAIADEGELAHVMLVAARQGGTLGTAVVTWSVCEGEFEFEPHLALNCKPTFHAKKRRRLIALEKRYKFKREIEVASTTGTQLREVDFWHREEWTEQAHIVYTDALVSDGAEPVWQIEDEVKHGWGRCPAVWIKNIDDADPSEIDGVSLLEGIADITEDIDRTLSQKSRAVRYNQDPERVYYGMTEEQVMRLRVGGGATTILPAKPAGGVELLEMNGEGQTIAENHIVAQRGRALETARVVAPEPERLLAAAKSGVALRILFSPMLELVGDLRSSYGRGLRDMLMQIVSVARAGRLSKLGGLLTPPPESIPDGKVKNQWGRFYDPTPDDLKTIAEAAALLKNSELLDHETILRSFASYFGIKDVSHVLEMAKKEADSRSEMEIAPFGAGGRAKQPSPDDEESAPEDVASEDPEAGAKE